MTPAEPMTPAVRHHILIEYLRVKLNEHDWHGVADAACDLRELEARHPELRAT